MRHVALAFRSEVLCAFEFVSAMSIDNNVYQDVTLFNLGETTAFRGKLLLPSSGCTKDGFIVFVEKVFSLSTRNPTVYFVVNCLTFPVFAYNFADVIRTPRRHIGVRNKRPYLSESLSILTSLPSTCNTVIVTNELLTTETCHFIWFGGNFAFWFRRLVTV